MKLYHYDRGGKLQPGQVIARKGFSATDTKIQPQMETLFPDGISFFGEKILTPFSYLIYGSHTLFELMGHSADANAINFTDLIWALDGPALVMQEYNLELVRRAFAPSMPSRLEAFFALGSVNDLVPWAKDLLCKEGKLFEINVPTAVCLDANQIPRVIQFDLNADNLSSSVPIPTAHLCEIGFSAPKLFASSLAYWKGQISDHPKLEYLVELPVRLGVEVQIPDDILRMAPIQ